tara:strand:- start:56 stop:232 length:177 start_codon:yes stop_codon:yes gene_type:complete
MRKYAPTVGLSKEQRAWIKKQELYNSHPIYKKPIVRKICEMFNGKVLLDSIKHNAVKP